MCFAASDAEMALGRARPDICSDFQSLYQVSHKRPCEVDRGPTAPINI
jgi:hypothetical protein